MLLSRYTLVRLHMQRRLWHISLQTLIHRIIFLINWGWKFSIRIIWPYCNQILIYILVSYHICFIFSVYLIVFHWCYIWINWFSVLLYFFSLIYFYKTKNDLISCGDFIKQFINDGRQQGNYFHLPINVI